MKVTVTLDDSEWSMVSFALWEKVQRLKELADSVEQGGMYPSMARFMARDQQAILNKLDAQREESSGFQKGRV